MVGSLTGVDVHLDHAALDSGLDLLLGRTGSTVEDKEPLVSGSVSDCFQRFAALRYHTHKGCSFGLPIFWATWV